MAGIKDRAFTMREFIREADGPPAGRKRPAELEATLGSFLRFNKRRRTDSATLADDSMAPAMREPHEMLKETQAPIMRELTGESTYVEIFLNSLQGGTRTPGLEKIRYEIAPGLFHVAEFAVLTMVLPHIPALGVPDTNTVYYLSISLLDKTAEKSRTGFGMSNVAAMVPVLATDRNSIFQNATIFTWHLQDSSKTVSAVTIELLDENLVTVATLRDNLAWHVRLGVRLLPGSV
jgi:hypothetical protein